MHHGIESGDELKRYAQFAEGSGFDSLWVTERYFHEETLSLVGFLAAVTKTINLGIGVVNPFTRSPSLTAMGAATIDRLTGGRFVLGLGRSDKQLITGKLGIDYENSLQRLEDCIESIRYILRSKSYSLRKDLNPIELAGTPLKSSVPLYMAAIGPKALCLASRAADGVILNTYSTIDYVHHSIKIIRESLEKNNRDPKSLRIACMLPVRLTDHVSDSLINECKRKIARILSEQFVGELFINQTGADKYLFVLRQAVYDDNENEIYKLITEGMVKQHYIIGNQKHCIDRINQYIDAGIDQPLLLPRLSGFFDVASTLNPKITAI